jgi:nucleoid-associated protein YgaU
MPYRSIANVGNNWELYKKAYFIEFLGEDGTTVEDAFAFSVPPESEELTYTQRKTETKTFGGLHVDEYGIDAVKIVLSGSTINQELKMIYGGEKGNKWLSGEYEIYYLRDLLKKHRTGADNLKKKIRLYDLSKMNVDPESAKEAAKKSIIKNYWQVFPGDFKIRRSNDRPFTYKYSFEFTGVSLEEGKDFESQIAEPTFKGTPPKTEDGDPRKVSSNTPVNASKPGKPDYLRMVMEEIANALDFIDGINGKVNNVLDKVNQVSKILKVLGNVMSYAANTLTGAVNSAGDSLAGVIDGFTNIVDGADSILSLPRDIQLSALNVGLELQNATKGLVKSVDSFSEDCRNAFTSEYREIPREVLDQYGMSNEEFKDSIGSMLNRAENIANEMAAAAKSSNIPEVTVGNPDPDTGAQRVILSYGNTSVMIKDTDTLESLAKKFFGDPNRAIDIAAYNGVASLSDLKPGDIIKIPITARTRKMKRNLIFARREDRDNYGKDILLSDDGLIMTSTSGDYALASGVKNLSQAVLLRLRESVAKRIRLNAYGIRTNISDPTAGVAYIIASIELTVNGDPRVSSVDDIRFSSGGDYLNVNIDYSDINKAGRNISGRV